MGAVSSKLYAIRYQLSLILKGRGAVSFRFSIPGFRFSLLLLVLAFMLLPRSTPIHSQPLDPHLVWLPILMKPNTNPIHQGIATYYDATGEGACMFDASPDDLMVAAMNADEYDNAAVCGAYVHVIGSQGEVTVRIVDLCPECKAGHLDLSEEAFAQIDNLPLGRVDITWQLISPTLAGPIAYHFKDGSNQWWTAVQIRNHRNPVAKLEYLSGGEWVSVPRTSYNYFVQTNPGMGVGPYTFRVTDCYGHVLTDSGIPHLENGTLNGASQFPVGP
jgi:expansin (peptidoglycan-binding protein)